MAEDHAGSGMMKGPERIPLQWLYVLLYGLSLLAVLWQHGHPLLTIMMGVLTLPAMLVPFIPFRLLNPLFRGILQMLVLLLAGLWGVSRFQVRAPLDLLLVESLSIAGFCFVFSTRIKDFIYLFFISLALLIYGSVYPREIYLYLVPVIFMLSLLLIYHNRTVGLAGDHRAALPSRAFRNNFLIAVIHLVIMCVIWFYLMTLFPRSNMPNQGIFPVSFFADQPSYAPPPLAKWFDSRYKLSADQGESESGDSPTEHDVQAHNLAELGVGEGMDADGNGGGMPGDELVMTVRSPVKLYWLARLYDSYDGRTWLSSEAMDNQRLNIDILLSSQRRELISQRITIYRWHSLVLPAAYRPANYTLTGMQSRLADSFYNVILGKDNLPSLPFSYKVDSSLLLSSPADHLPFPERIDVWEESLPREHYLSLPSGKISSRVKELSAAIVQGVALPYDRAIALRDHLRENYPYNQFSPILPEDCEATDYFLFDIREGHCEYFAGALTVMARSCGLPARVATGFSPGDFNALRGIFEVREYHAHAWTQIFINGLGWLTFDPTPTGEIRSRTRPFGIGSLHDPFGEEWRVTPPELASATQKVISELKKDSLTALSRADPGRSGGQAAAPDRKEQLRRMIMQIPTSEDELQQTMQNAGITDAARGIKSNYWRTAQRLKSGMIAVWREFKRSMRKFFSWLWSPAGIVFLDIIFILVVLYYSHPLLTDVIRKRIKFRHCQQLWIMANERCEDEPGQAIGMAYRTIRELLELAGLPRKNNMELLEYGRSLESVSQQLCRDVLAVFFLYSQFCYSEQEPEPEDAAAVIGRVGNIRQEILPRIGRGHEL